MAYDPRNLKLIPKTVASGHQVSVEDEGYLLQVSNGASVATIECPAGFDPQAGFRFAVACDSSGGVDVTAGAGITVQAPAGTGSPAGLQWSLLEVVYLGLSQWLLGGNLA